MHEDERKLCRDVAPDSPEQQLDPDRVGDHQTEDVLVVFVGEKSRGGQAHVVTLQASVHSHAGPEVRKIVIPHCLVVVLPVKPPGGG